MAGRGPARKPAGATSDKRNGKILPKEPDAEQALATAGDAPRLSVDVPTRPAKLTATVRRAWDDFWASDVAVLVQRSDLHALRRLFLLYAEREQCHGVVVSRRVTRVPLKDAVAVGLIGTLVHDQDDEGKTHNFVEVEHDGRIAIGSQGQMVLSPYSRDLRTIDAEIRQLEDRFGLNVRGRAALAIAVGAGPTQRPTAPARAAPTAPPEADRDLLDL